MALTLSWSLPPGRETSILGTAGSQGNPRPSPALTPEATDHLKSVLGPSPDSNTHQLYSLGDTTYHPLPGASLTFLN